MWLTMAVVLLNFRFDDFDSDENQVMMLLFWFEQKIQDFVMLVVLI
jgi:hypothetical protein